MQNLNQLQALMRMFNFLNITQIASLLSENVVYSSELVLTPIFGKDDVMEFLENKMETMRSCVNEGRCGYYSYLSESDEFPNELFVALEYRVDVEYGRILIRVRVNPNNDLIEHIQLLENTGNNQITF